MRVLRAVVRRPAASVAAALLLTGAAAAPAAAEPSSAGPARPASSAAALQAELDAYRAAGSSDLTFPGMPWPATRPGPYVDRVDWVTLPTGPSLQVRPTRAGRAVTGWGVPDAAWREVLALDPAAATPGMRAQFDCHWVFARLVEPNKPSWNLEPDRPAAGPLEMIATRCNPGFAEES